MGTFFRRADFWRALRARIRDHVTHFVDTAAGCQCFQRLTTGRGV